jgi:hypothetical protein
MVKSGRSAGGSTARAGGYWYCPAGGLPNGRGGEAVAADVPWRHRGPPGHAACVVPVAFVERAYSDPLNGSVDVKFKGMLFLKP